MTEVVYWDQEVEIEGEIIEVEVTAVIEGSLSEGWSVEDLHVSNKALTKDQCSQIETDMINDMEVLLDWVERAVWS